MLRPVNWKRGMTRLFGTVLALGLTAAVLPAVALADQPKPWQMGFQEPVSPVMAQIIDLHDFITWIMVAVVVLVFAVLAYVMVRFNEQRNPTPSKKAHNLPLEIVWTVIPIIILVIIAGPSFRLLFFMDKAQDAEMTIKAIGHQWYWSYEYPDHGDFTFDAYIKDEEDLEEGEPRLLATDETVVLPVDTTIRILTTADDVIHAWAVPAFGIKIDAVPGRLQEAWVKIEREGDYYGMCSELCGVNHGFMPIAIKAVSKEKFAEWVEWAQEEYAVRDSDAPLKVASTRMEEDTK